MEKKDNMNLPVCGFGVIKHFNVNSKIAMFKGYFSILVSRDFCFDDLKSLSIFGTKTHLNVISEKIIHERLLTYVDNKRIVFIYAAEINNDLTTILDEDNTKFLLKTSEKQFPIAAILNTDTIKAMDKPRKLKFIDGNECTHIDFAYESLLVDIPVCSISTLKKDYFHEMYYFFDHINKEEVDFNNTIEFSLDELGRLMILCIDLHGNIFISSLELEKVKEPRFCGFFKLCCFK